MESKLTSALNDHTNRLLFYGILIAVAFVLFIIEDPLNWTLHPYMGEMEMGKRTTRATADLNAAYVLEQNFHSAIFYLSSCVFLGFTKLIGELFVSKRKKVDNIFYFVFVSAAIFRAYSFCDGLDRLQGEYYFKGIVDKLLGLFLVIYTITNYFKKDYRATEKRT